MVCHDKMLSCIIKKGSAADWEKDELIPVVSVLIMAKREAATRNMHVGLGYA